MIATLLQIAGLFAVLSLLAFGGGAAVLPDMQRSAVEVHHWVTAREFLDMFAISRADAAWLDDRGAGRPEGGGRGWRPGGAAGDVRAVVGAGLSPGARSGTAPAARPGGEMLEQALAPVSVGLTIASGIAIARGTEHDWPAYAVTAATTLLLAFTRLHPLAVMAAGAGLLMLAGG